MASKPMPASMVSVTPVVTAPWSWFMPARPARAPAKSIA